MSRNQVQNVRKLLSKNSWETKVDKVHEVISDIIVVKILVNVAIVECIIVAIKERIIDDVDVNKFQKVTMVSSTSKSQYRSDIQPASTTNFRIRSNISILFSIFHSNHTLREHAPHQGAQNFFIQVPKHRTSSTVFPWLLMKKSI